ncbi:MAG TPA: hypothetical protein VE781_01615 [Kineosporiaceae bacterium]|nr:hypothetical protein [Kineosporiaceae bacterium]
MWRRAHDRFRRAVDRYHQMLERVPPGAARDRLEGTGGRLAALLDDVHGVCREGQRLAPSAGEDLPGGHGGALLDAHRALARAATLAAQASEAVTLTVVALRAGRDDEVLRLPQAAERTVDQVAEQVGRARASMSEQA